MDVLDLLSKHSSIRKFKSDAIDDHLFEKSFLQVKPLPVLVLFKPARLFASQTQISARI